MTAPPRESQGRRGSQSDKRASGARKNHGKSVGDAGAAGGAGVTWVRRVVYDGRPYYYNTDRSVAPELRVSTEKPEELMSKEEKARRAGRWVWVPHPSDNWQPAKLTLNKDGSAVVQPEKGGAATIPASGPVPANTSLTGPKAREVPRWWDVSWTTCDWVEEDIIKLDGINEASILFNLHKRFDQDEIYTWVGTNGAVLLSINPYKQIDALYSAETMKRHRGSPNRPDAWAPPHVYNVVNAAYEQLRRGAAQAQSILVSGESGAGKTEATKQMLEFLGEQIGSDSVEHNIAEKLLLSNPLIEAFGNAMTIRNNNSSRFGKFITTYFSKKTHKITGASFRNFMLESTRVVRHQEGARNYHIFYEMLQDSATAQAMGLGAPKDFAYLNQSSKSLEPFAGDAPGFKTVVRALGAMGFSEAETGMVWRMLAGVLYAGNLTFKDKEEAVSRVMGSLVVDDAPLKSAAEHWAVDLERLREVVTSRTVTARGETARVALDARSAKDAVDALSKSVYNTLFQLLVSRMNQAMEPSGDDAAGSCWIGMLDVFGFESLTTNSFEQLCINYCNEKLQNNNNKRQFLSEEAFYRTEGVNYSFLKPRDHQELLDLLERTQTPLGLLVSLDDEGALPGGSDKGWMNKIEQSFGKHPLFQAGVRAKLDPTQFQVRHYAGVVVYNSQEFVGKNRDTMWANLYELMSSSQLKVVQLCYPKGSFKSDIKPVSFTLRNSVNELITLVASTDARYVRCIKPNWKQAKEVFDSNYVVDQLTNGGVFETVELRKGGYPFRLRHKQFAFQFSCINKRSMYDARLMDSGDWKEVCRQIVALNPKLSKLGDDIIVGNTMVLYKVSVHKPLVLMRNISVEMTMPLSQAIMRGGMARSYMRRLTKCRRTLLRGLEDGTDLAPLRDGLEQGVQAKQWLEPNVSFLPGFPAVLEALLQRATHLEARLVAWQAHVAEMESTLHGIKGAKPDGATYRVLGAQTQKADKDFADVKRTKQQAGVYDECRAMMSSVDRGVREATEHAVEALEAAVKARNDLPRLRAAIAQGKECKKMLEPYLPYVPEFPQDRLSRAISLEERLAAYDAFCQETQQRTGKVQPKDVDVPMFRLLHAFCDRSDEEFADVARTAPQQQLYDRCQELWKNSPPGTLEMDAKAALLSLQRARMEEVKAVSDRLQLATPSVDKIKKVLERMAFLDAEAAEALAEMDPLRMHACVDEAADYKYSNKALEEIKRRMALSEEEFVKLELDAALQHKDHAREVHRRIRLQEIAYDKPGTDKLALVWANTKIARDPMQHAAMAGFMLCGRSELVKSMYNWTPKKLPATLTVTPGEVSGQPDAPNVKKLKQELVKNFTNIQKAMGDKKVAKPQEADKAAELVLKLGRETEAARNEIYYQLIKQLSNNPNPDSLAKGYDLLACCLQQFLPSDEFVDNLVMWLRKHPGPSGSYKPFVSAMHTLQYGPDKVGRNKSLDELRKDFARLSKEGSRMSLHDKGAFTGPSKPKPPHKKPQRPKSQRAASDEQPQEDIKIDDKKPKHKKK